MSTKPGTRSLTIPTSIPSLQEPDEGVAEGQEVPFFLFKAGVAQGALSWTEEGDLITFTGPRDDILDLAYYLNLDSDHPVFDDSVEAHDETKEK